MAEILLIEPDIKLGKIYLQFLQSNGHSVQWRTSAQKALNSIDEQRPEVILLELQLLAHNGVEFLYELRSYKDLQNIPVIVHSQVPQVLKAISPMLWDDLGIVDYLYKPATRLQDLRQTVETVLLNV